jgi:type VI secretion system protein ImpM
MGDAPAQIGFFGKLPSHGDFVRRSLPPDLIKRWDDWLQSGLAASREALGDDWLDCYLSSPIWRFCFSAGVCGDARWIGAMMPSVDRVGRYFPLTVATRIPASRSLFATAAEADPWFIEIEQAMLRTLEEDSLAADAFAERLANITPLDARPAHQLTQDPQSMEPGSFIRVPLADSAGLQDAAGTLMDAMALRCLGTFSLWWSAGSPYVESSARVFADLPATSLFWTLLCNDRQSG